MGVFGVLGVFLKKFGVFGVLGGLASLVASIGCRLRRFGRLGRFGRRSRVSRCDEYLGDLRALCEFPSQGVLASAVTDHQYFHHTYRRKGSSIGSQYFNDNGGNVVVDDRCWQMWQACSAPFRRRLAFFELNFFSGRGRLSGPEHQQQTLREFDRSCETTSRRNQRRL